MSHVPTGIQIGASTAPSELGAVAAEAERLGYDEIWLAEDYFELGGFASSAIALASTEHIPVGLGVVVAAVHRATRLGLGSALKRVDDEPVAQPGTPK